MRKDIFDNRPLSTYAPFDVIYKTKGITCIPASFKFIKRVCDHNHAGYTRNTTCISFVRTQSQLPNDRSAEYQVYKNICRTISSI